MVALMAVQLCALALLGVVFVLSWETEWQVLAPALVGGGFGLVGMIVGVITWRRWRAWSPWSETQQQLARDLELLREELNDA